MSTYRRVVFLTQTTPGSSFKLALPEYSRSGSLPLGIATDYLITDGVYTKQEPVTSAEAGT